METLTTEAGEARRIAASLEAAGYVGTAIRILDQIGEEEDETTVELTLSVKDWDRVCEAEDVTIEEVFGR